MQVGDRFFLRGGKIALPEGRDFCLYALQSAIPLLLTEPLFHDEEICRLVGGKASK